ncbi:MAG: hypothetical protein AB7I30_03040 [Isosphaeraceae bacterium]
MLNREFRTSPLIEPILDMLKGGKENLDVLNWAIDHQHPRDQVLLILEVLDINSRRIECQFGKRFSQAC